MHSNRTEGLFAMAEELLLAAEHEQQRAEEDVVSHLICHHSRQSISNFLAGYILQKDMAIQHPVSINSLHEQCIAIDSRFESLDLGQIECRCDTHDRKYCLDQHKVDSCLSVAQHVRSIVQAEIPGY
ncbi:MAG TPA: hypothetical protein VFV79_10960 [Saprospiraceae bacterium]|nr:hypothetical protein [Saprospiraceae bacterium]